MLSTNIFLIVIFSLCRLKQLIRKNANKGRKSILNIEQYHAIKNGALNFSLAVKSYFLFGLNVLFVIRSLGNRKFALFIIGLSVVVVVVDVVVFSVGCKLAVSSLST